MYCFDVHPCKNDDCPIKLAKIKKCWAAFEKTLGRPPGKDECPFAPCDKCLYKAAWDIGLINESLFSEDDETTPEDLLPKRESISQHFKALKNPDKNMRFCYEILNCNNTSCPVRQQQIIKCFNYFNPKLGKKNCAQCFYKKGWDLGIIDQKIFADVIKSKKLKRELITSRKQNTLIEAYLAEVAHKDLDRDEELKIAKRLLGKNKDPQKAYELITQANLKLVARISKNYSYSPSMLMDIIQEGNIGLMKAAKNFNSELGYKFSTYASYWIRYYMQKAIAEQRHIRIPHHLLTFVNKLKRKIKNFTDKEGRNPTLAELSELTGAKEEKILNAINVTNAPLTIYSEDKDDENSSAEIYIKDKTTLTPEEVSLEKIKNEALHKAVSKLPERLQYVINYYYGFEDDLSLAEIARRLGISRERARQLLKQALEKLQEQDSLILKLP